MQRRLFIAAYDVRNDTRLRHMLYVLKGYASGGQKSVFECYLGKAELEELVHEVATVLNLKEDRFALTAMSPCNSVDTLGIAVKPADPEYFYIG